MKMKLLMKQNFPEQVAGNVLLFTKPLNHQKREKKRTAKYLWR